ncbi:MAG: deoxyribonuclease HsdR, partial [Candidatus Electrothrix sp. AR3]|nr:deoxyribonuclease HsdR [Candidatus Electrothrix sp. AR3]
LDRKLKDHTLLQAIARVNRTHNNKGRGFIVDYYGFSDCLADALEVFSSEDIQGVIKSLKDEIPKLNARHIRVIKHFKDINDKEACIDVLKDQEIRQSFNLDFKKFCRSMNIVMPNPAARPYLNDLKQLGKIKLGARNLYRDNQLSLTVASAGAKVQQLIQEHLHAIGIDSKIPPIDLLAADFREHLQGLQSPKAKASELEHAIKAHISINLEEDPAYYKKFPNV